MPDCVTYVPGLLCNLCVRKDTVSYDRPTLLVLAVASSMASILTLTDVILCL